MSLFAKKVTVFGPETVSVGDFDPTVDGCYRNVVTIPLDVKPRRNLYVSLKSDNPVDIVVANDDRSAAGHKENQTELVFGPFPTKSMDSMGIILGIYRGEKAQVTLEAWIDKRWTSSRRFRLNAPLRRRRGISPCRSCSMRRSGGCSSASRHLLSYVWHLLSWSLS